MLVEFCIDRLLGAGRHEYLHRFMRVTNGALEHAVLDAIVRRFRPHRHDSKNSGWLIFHIQIVLIATSNAAASSATVAPFAHKAFAACGWMSGL